MYEKYRQELSGFEKVWKRVAGERVKMPEKLKLKPAADKGRNGGGKGRLLR